ncbi:MAG: transcriptional regulator [Pseudomonas sp.]
MKSFFPLECADNLYRIGLLVKSRRLQSRLRQKDLALSLSISEQTVRKIEGGDPLVELRSFMMVLWQLGLTQEVFRSLDGIESSSQLQANDPHTPHRVRLAKPRRADAGQTP